LRFAPETGQPLGIVRDLRQEDLQRNGLYGCADHILDLTPNGVDSVPDASGQTRNGVPEFGVSATEALAASHDGKP
jgi:hypothetical protein